MLSRFSSAAYVLDKDGTLVNEGVAIPGAPEFLDRIRVAGTVCLRVVGVHLDVPQDLVAEPLEVVEERGHFFPFACFRGGWYRCEFRPLEQSTLPLDRPLAVKGLSVDCYLRQNQCVERGRLADQHGGQPVYDMPGRGGCGA